MHRFRKHGILLVLLAILLTITGCGFGLDKTLKEIDPPKVDYVDDEKALDTDASGSEKSATEEPSDGSSVDKADESSAAPGEEGAAETTGRQLYLLDKNGMVVPQMLQLPATKEVAKQALEYLVKDGPVTELLPNGFQAVIPADTKVSVNKVDDTIVADFSKEFENYQADQEQAILEAITWTLTQFDGVKNVKLRINGHDLTEMPVNGTPIGDGVSRADGINVQMGNIVDVTNSTGVTLYFLAQSDDQTYYVPVTKRVEGAKDNVAATIKGLIEGPALETGLFTEFSRDVKVLNKTLDEGLLTLDFNEAILGGEKQQAISDEALNSLVLSLTEQNSIKEVAITVDGKAGILNEKGEPLSEPVTRPVKVNAVGF
ncbi:GerMN domain-containing protein [Pseudalkalibacillus caeni]|uniref:Sporulation protein n=1 Tax=Exobacillus caeni TaxID=2574798 RepID=A0A5R9F638_9BACL|nr:GerMN domain-containing protein [Pseudalkalibacillus caeni]TLS39202.1 sporulation protein [Pseudalkalibacillus caeni]